MADDTQEHVQVYDKLIKAIPTDYIDDQTQKHGEALPDAISSLKGKKLKYMNQGIDAFTDAYLAYAKAMGKKSVSQEKEDRHIYTGKISAFLKNYQQQTGKNVLSMLRRGTAYKVLLDLLESEHAQDLEHKLQHELRVILPEDKSPKFYQNIAQHHIKTTDPTAKYTEAELLELAQPENLLQFIAGYKEQKHTNKHKYDPVDKKDTKKK